LDKPPRGAGPHRRSTREALAPKRKMLEAVLEITPCAPARSSRLRPGPRSVTLYELRAGGPGWCFS